MTKSGRVYNKKMIAFLEEHYKNHFLLDLVDMFNKEFGKSKTKNQIKSVLKNYSIKAGVKRNRTPRKYTDEHLAWIKEMYQELNIPRLTRAFNEFFNMNVTEQQLRAVTKNHNITCERTGRFEIGKESWNKGMKGLQLGGESGWFKPGHTPVNHRPLESERVNKYGYIEIKIAEPNVWDLKHRVVWRKHHGEIGPADLIQFRNNDKTDCRVENLYLATQR